MSIARVTDPDDERLADYRNVPDPELLERRGVFVAEGRLVVRRLLTGSRFSARSVMVTETGLASVADALDGREGVPVYVVPQPLMNDVTGFNIHRGCLAIGERRAEDNWRLVTADAIRLVALERVGNADNVGSVFRNAAAFACDAVLIGPACADPLYRKAIRTSMGAVLSLPFARALPWPQALTELRNRGFAVIGMTPQVNARPFSEIARSIGPRPMAIVLGHEGDGLTPEALASCESHARIPMADGVDSVNVATAAAIALYHSGLVKDD